jgi:hypothetical protein
LSISKAGELNGKIMPVYWWAQKRTVIDPELADRCAWLIETIEGTRRRHQEQRWDHAIQ